MTLNPVSPLSFPLLLRIPVWAGGATIQINGRSERPAEPNTFAREQRTWNAGDVVEIKFPLEPRASRWFNNSVTVERGPLVILGLAQPNSVAEPRQARYQTKGERSIIAGRCRKTRSI